MNIQDAASILYPTKTFSGSDFQPARDEVRLTGQLETIFRFMKHGHEWTLREIATQTGAPESSVSAQLRNLRKPQFGGHTVNKEYVSKGLYRYALIINQNTTE